MFVSASSDFQIHSISETGIENYPQESQTKSKITSVSICNDNTYLALLRENEKPQIFSTKELENIRLIHTINVSNVYTLTFKHNTKKIIALGTRNGEVIIYDTKSRTVANIFPKITDCVKFLDFSCDDEKLCGFDDKIFFVFPEINLNNNVQKYKQNSDCTALKCHAYIENRVAIGFWNGSISLWDINSGTEILQINILKSPARGISMSSCGNFLIVSGAEVKICELNIPAASCTFQYTLPLEKISSVDLSPDDKFLAVGLEDGSLKIYDVAQQLKEIHFLKTHESPISCIVFENRAKEPNSNFSSVVKLPSDHSVPKKSETLESCLKRKSNRSLKEDSLEKLKRSLIKMLRSEMDSLENQLQEHCNKFQKFLDNEFETIDGIIKKKWDVFNLGDMNQIITAICPEDGKSNCD